MVLHQLGDGSGPVKRAEAAVRTGSGHRRRTVGRFPQGSSCLALGELLTDRAGTPTNSIAEIPSSRRPEGSKPIGLGCVARRRIDGNGASAF